MAGGFKTFGRSHSTGGGIGKTSTLHSGGGGSGMHPKVGGLSWGSKGKQFKGPGSTTRVARGLFKAKSLKSPKAMDFTKTRPLY